MAIFKRFPKWQQIAPVYAIIVLVVYSWTIYWFFWRLPSWMYFLSISEILTIFAYTTATNLLESLFVLLAPITLSLLLPKKWFCDAFVVRGTTLVMLGLGYMMYFATRFTDVNDYPAAMIKVTPYVLVIILVLVFLLGRIGFLSRIIEAFANRAVILLYLSIPASIISLVIVIIRNIT